jgi:hypothetical protein
MKEKRKFRKQITNLNTWTTSRERGKSDSKDRYNNLKIKGRREKRILKKNERKM